MPLCERCELKSDTRGHGYTYAQLRQTTCEFCQLIYVGIAAILSPLTPLDNHSAFFPSFSPDEKDNFEVFSFIHGIFISFSCSWGTTCPWGILPTRRDITTLDSNGEGSFNTALGWIQNCVSQHECSGNISTPLPTRVINCGLDGSPIRIVNGNSKCARYVCLSHCWGEKRPLMTTSKTLAGFLEEIPWSAIPATFQDAIVFARKLGVQYIWIDSLCIIQDSAMDWAIESSRMADIYRNSYVTIAATASKSSMDGLGLKHIRQRGITLNGTTSSDIPYSIRCQYAIAPDTIRGKETPEGAIEHPIPSIRLLNDYGEVMPIFPLLMRGWVFQERLLSPRFLQFGRDELLWDCRESMLCECGQRQQRPDLPSNQVSLVKYNDSDLLAHKWRKIIELYCSLNLTFSTDNLPALSGLAKQMGEHRPESTYLAGLWSGSLEMDLLWIPYGPNRMQVDEYLAPSWSWASSGRRIIYPGLWRSHEKYPSVKTMESYFEVLSASCVASTVDPNGRVEDGFLKLSVPLFPLTVDPTPEDSQACILRYGKTPFFLGDGDHPKTRPGNWRMPFDDHSRRVFLDSMDTRGRLKDKKLYSCRLTRIEILENSTYVLVLGAREVIQIEFSLLLEQLDGSHNTFKRVGLLADGRVIDGHKGDAESWTKELSCFEGEISRSEVTIV
ncbi:HET-domain-containing protein [Annulohypoxylon moriforme]|nr:HET-domain-containing protein [Annulohypoxylon moriforme]